jgi:hypothetical protein
VALDLAFATTVCWDTEANAKIRHTRGRDMPSLFRFLTVVAVMVGIVYGVVYALANFVTPKPREMTVTIPPDKFLKK